MGTRRKAWQALLLQSTIEWTKPKFADEAKLNNTAIHNMTPSSSSVHEGREQTHTTSDTEEMDGDLSTARSSIPAQSSGTAIASSSVSSHAQKPPALLDGGGRKGLLDAPSARPPPAKQNLKPLRAPWWTPLASVVPCVAPPNRRRGPRGTPEPATRPAAAARDDPPIPMSKSERDTAVTSAIQETSMDAVSPHITLMPTEDSTIIVPIPTIVLPPSETGFVTSGAVQPPGSTGRERDGSILERGSFRRKRNSTVLGEGDSLFTDEGERSVDGDGSGESDGDREEQYEGEEEENEDARLMRMGGAGIPIGPDGVPRPLLPPLDPTLSGKKCLVLDLDETLLHSSFKILPNADYVIPLELDGLWHNVYCIKRPGVDAFLREMGELYEVVVFTASLSMYADPVLDRLDQHNVISHRLFREDCYFHRGIYVKDLSRLGRPVSSMLILDNSPASYIFHPNNAVPVTSWFNDPHDRELSDLGRFLADITDVEDVRAVMDLNLAY